MGQRKNKNTRSEATAPIWPNNNLENSEASEVEDEQSSYFSTPGTLNIQNENWSSGAHSILENSLPGPSQDDTRDARSLIAITHLKSWCQMCEVSKFILVNKVNYAFIIETWLRSSVVDSVIDIPSYSVVQRDHQSDHHGGICL